MEIPVAFVIAFITSLLFVRYREGSVTPLIVFFVLLFMAAISSQFWIPRFGPDIWGVSWIPMLITVIVCAVLFSLPARLKKKSGKDETATEAISLFTGILFFLLLVAIAAGVYRSRF